MNIQCTGVAVTAAYLVLYTMKVLRQKSSQQVVHIDLREKTFTESLILSLKSGPYLNSHDTPPPQNFHGSYMVYIIHLVCKIASWDLLFESSTHANSVKSLYS